MRWAIVALALFAAGCAALPEEVRIRFPDWMRGQGFDGQAAQTQPAAAQPPAATPAAPAGLVFPTGEFPSVYAAFTAQVPGRYPATATQATVVADLTAQGFSCTADSARVQTCERLQPIAGGCQDVFIVTAPVAGGAAGDVRRRCPLGTSGAPVTR
jgi:hypothetical protein